MSDISPLKWFRKRGCTFDFMPAFWDAGLILQSPLSKVKERIIKGLAAPGPRVSEEQLTSHPATERRRGGYQDLSEHSYKEKGIGQETSVCTVPCWLAYPCSSLCKYPFYYLLCNLPSLNMLSASCQYGQWSHLICNQAPNI